ncbi:peptide/nickel transport system permease protein [Amycolatopsis bartoniae]|uniref:ABC transporter permease n=1 Tax=Amycolatopsis bartoniae TaxID=941986 RepID=A0A8H9IXE6_9PSEU|nr:ABC transporter permease [Amycolatopsis bartoniae]MBB2933549.1 peptide/nickel transport system permease protein [Amycolatopsis bartoniae]TVT10732.1 ABC transporter permease [Amycolatopsis bartoniae]GHF73346.1 ABC transporter permease [Amycolatopsis bartoniae]
MNWNGRVSLSFMVGAVLMTLFIGTGVVSLFWLPYDVDRIDIAHKFASPGTAAHLLGTDALGRDVLAQLMSGAKVSLLVSVVSTVVAVVPGVVLGLVIAGIEGRIQSVLIRVTDVGLALPGILVALVLATAIGAGKTAAIIAIVFSFIPIVVRVTIGPAKQVLALEYIEAAYSYGRSRLFVLFRHVLPNVASVIIVLASVMFASAILVEAALSYLGVGSQRPEVSWGLMLNESQATVDTAPYLVVFPGLAIVIAVLGFNLMGDGLRSAFDPHQTKAVIA